MNALEDFGNGFPVSIHGATDLCDLKINEKARVISEFVDTDYFIEPRRRVPAAYLYENKNAQRFLVFAFRAHNQSDYSGIYGSYGRGTQIANAVEWLGGKPLPVICCGHPYGYCRCNEDQHSVAAAYFNCSPDGIDKLDFSFYRDVKKVKIIGGKGSQTNPRTVTVRDIRAYAYVAIEAEV